MAKLDHITNFINDPILKRAFLFLEEGDWVKANVYFEDVLNKDPENGIAYLGKLLIDTQTHVCGELMELAHPFDTNINYQRCMRYLDKDMVNELYGYNNYVKERNAMANSMEQSTAQIALPSQNINIQNNDNNDNVNSSAKKSSYKSLDFWFSMNGTRTRKSFFLVTVFVALFGFVSFFVLSWYLHPYRGFISSADIKNLVIIPVVLFWFYVQSVNCIRRIQSIGKSKTLGICCCALSLFIAVYLIWEEIGNSLGLIGYAPGYGYISWMNTTMPQAIVYGILCALCFEIVIYGIFFLILKDKSKS